MSWLASCISHTMKRLSNVLKKNFIHVDQYLYSCLCFSLLINCTDVAMVNKYYALICTIFLSSSADNQFDEAFKSLKSVLKNRPEYIHEVQRLFNTIWVKADLVQDSIELSIADSDIDVESEGD